MSAASRRVRVLLASDTYLPSVNGAAYFTSRIAQALAAAGPEVAVIARQSLPNAD